MPRASGQTDGAKAGAVAAQRSAPAAAVVGAKPPTVAAVAAGEVGTNDPRKSLFVIRKDSEDL